MSDIAFWWFLRKLYVLLFIWSSSKDNKNGFQWDAYQPLQWPPLDVRPGGLPTEGVCLQGEGSATEGVCLQRGLPTEGSAYRGEGVCLQGGRGLLQRGLPTEGVCLQGEGVCLQWGGGLPTEGVGLQRSVCL